MTSLSLPNPSHAVIRRVVDAAIRSNTPILLWGEPGSGKTAFIESLAEVMGCPVETLAPGTLDPTDIAGLPINTGEKEDGLPVAEFAPPSWARRLTTVDKIALLFFDEVNTANSAVQGALLRVIQSRYVGQLPLDPQVRLIAAANPPKSSAGGWKLAPAMTARWVHVWWQPSVDDIITGMTSGWPKADPYAGTSEETVPREEIMALIAGFLAANPEHAQHTDIQGELKLASSPRSWDRLADMFSRLAEDDTEAQEVVAHGILGTDTATAFIAYLLILSKLPALTAVLDGSASLDDIEAHEAHHYLLNAFFRIGKPSGGGWDKTAEQVLLPLLRFHPTVAIGYEQRFVNHHDAEEHPDRLAKIADAVIEVSKETSGL